MRCRVVPTVLVLCYVKYACTSSNVAACNFSFMILESCLTSSVKNNYLTGAANRYNKMRFTCILVYGHDYLETAGTMELRLQTTVLEAVPLEY